MTSLYDFPLTPLPSRSLLKVTEPPVRRCGEGSRSGVRFLLNLATVLLLIPPAASAQNTTYARLVGTVTDQTGAVLPGVEVTVETRSTNVAQTTLTDERGDYIVDRLLAGRYDLRADLPGFKSYVALDIRLEVNQVARADVKMSPGEIADQVTVPARSTIIDTDSVEVGTVVEEQKILDLPLRGRDLLKLVYLTTGGTQEQQEIGWVRFGGGYPTFNGLYSHSNLNLLDGVRNQNFFFQAPAVTPTPETIQEFKVITNNYSAEHGQVGGAVISMLSKSGNNELHGHAWYYFRDERFDASSFFANRFGQDKQEVNYQILGGSVGGPIIKDRTFFHAHYERFHDDLQQSRFRTVPNEGARQGDLSGAGNFGPIPQLYDPFNVVDGRRVPFPGNQIPESRWHPTYQKLMQAMPPPAPNVEGVTSNNFTYPDQTRNRINKYSIRGDHHFDSDTLFGRFSWQNFPRTFHYGNVGPPKTSVGGIAQAFQDNNHGWQTAFGWVNPMGANLVTELSASIWRFRNYSKPFAVDDEINWGRELGYDDADRHPVFYADGSRGPGGLPSISASGYIGWSARGSASTFSDWGLTAKYTTSWRRGSHYLKVGFEHVRNLDVQNRIVLMHGGAQDRFDGFATGQILRNAEGNVAGASFGEPWADLMLGLPNHVSGNKLGEDAIYANFSQSHYSWFVNDDWKLGPNLTLSLGLRWEQPRPPVYAGRPDQDFPTDYHYCAFDYSQAQGRIDPVQLMPGGFDIDRWQGPDGLAVPFANLDRRGCHQAKWRYFAPRFGLAWRMLGNNRTVLRFGAGLSYDQEAGTIGATPMFPVFGAVTAFRPRGTETPDLILGKLLDLPTETELGEYRSNYFTELDREEGQVYSYNLSIQHEIFTGTKLEVGYVGNQGRHLREISVFNNSWPEGYVASLVGGEKVTLTSDAITAGPRDWIPGDNESRSWSGQRARRPYPQVVPNVIPRSLGNMYYNSLQAKLERRFRDGLALSLGYTWSKAMALNFNGGWGTWQGSREYERHSLKAPMRHDRPNTLYNATIWQLPFFKNSSGLTRTFLGGWEATGIVTLTSGSTYQVYYGRDLWDQGFRNRLSPDRVGDGFLSENERTVDRWFDTSAFVAPIMDSDLPPAERARRSQGNSAPYPLRGDGPEVVDLALHKRFAFGGESILRLPGRPLQRLQPHRLQHSQWKRRFRIGRESVRRDDGPPDPVRLPVFLLNQRLREYGRARAAPGVLSGGEGLKRSGSRPEGSYPQPAPINGHPSGQTAYLDPGCLLGVAPEPSNPSVRA